MVSNLGIKQLVNACGKCHVDSRVEFVTEYEKMIHGRQKLLDENPFVIYKNTVFQWLNDGIIYKIENKLISPVQSYLTTRYKEYLKERDKAVSVPTRTD
jgi:hypothetical protein